MTARRNFHASALVLGSRGFLIVGPSGSGKSSLALCLLANADARDLYAAFVSDDQVFLSSTGGIFIAESIPAIEGRAEVRGSEIVSVPAVAAAVMDFAVIAVSQTSPERLPPEKEMHHLDGFGSLPLLRLPLEAKAPLDILLRLADERQT
jgi:serine kinase of HPr protein (carbohydrate metabolism regulator)